ncbi:XTP/dITP diphosphohydrolase [Mycolicibacterium sp. BK556]|uniref:nucleoside triphosphate pyrophosphohydrolase n=1 Tax=unclassified Mycolicibacterium TaxID=2636767 RepID=UPI00161EC9CF|nr:XTP/dITP diphosphohydrolase [Mycolicibacterium sp. BK556]MBB3631935.1 XTP/dITP diphosphohydrolase [Mycolicibacterium sp. BK607]MBB3749954.1 XTP/dITP diphosphohydrolase [Mycolicibacterium sp. BK634]
MTVILVDPRRPSMVPVDAVELLGGDVQYTEEMPVKVPWSLPSARPVFTGEDAPVLLSSDRQHPEVRARLAAGERLIAAPEPQPGERLVDAVAIMDKLRTAGPWESEQTHDSLRRYLLEETYELFDAVRGGDLHELRDELGDVLLQVLFHARIAEEASHKAFTIDDVADALVRKLGHRVPAVLAGESISLEDQLAQWEERKALETSKRVSCVDEVPTGQPALALAQKVIARVLNAGLPAEFIPASIVTVTVAAEKDAENELRTEVLVFMDTVRAVERAIAANRRDADVPSQLDVAAPLGAVSADEWRRHWPALIDEPAGEPLELPLVPDVVSGDDDLLDDVDIVLVDSGDDGFDVPELAVDDVDLDEPADQPNSVEPQ